MTMLTEPTKNAQEPQVERFLVSIHVEEWDEASLEAGQTDVRGMEVEREVIDADDLRGYGQKYGFSTASSLPHTTSFSSTVPPEDRAFFEEGVRKYFTLDVHEVNGHKPEDADYLRVAEIIGVPLAFAVRQGAALLTPASLVERFIEDTDLLPTAFADRICGELLEILGSQAQGPVLAYLQSEQFTATLVEKTGAVYGGNLQFRALLCALDDPRAQYAAYMRHWASGELLREFPALRSALPPRFAQGEAPGTESAPEVLAAVQAMSVVRPSGASNTLHP